MGTYAILSPCGLGSVMWSTRPYSHIFSEMFPARKPEMMGSSSPRRHGRFCCVYCTPAGTIGHVPRKHLHGLAVAVVHAVFVSPYTSSTSASVGFTLSASMAFFLSSPPISSTAIAEEQVVAEALVRIKRSCAPNPMSRDPPNPCRSPGRARSSGSPHGLHQVAQRRLLQPSMIPCVPLAHLTQASFMYGPCWRTSG